MKVRELTSFLETIAPPQLQEDYDNSGLIIGNPETEINGVLICLDSIESIIEEAINLNCNLIIAHHPIIFKGVKRLNGKNYIERTIIKAIKNNICIYAIHTNLDNVLFQGVNSRIAEIIGLENTSILLPKANLVKLEISCLSDNKDRLLAIIEKEGRIGGDHFVVHQEQNEGSIVTMYCICESYLARNIYSLLNNEDLAISSNVIKIENESNIHGSGIIGILPKPMKTMEFLAFIKDKMKCGSIRYTSLMKEEINKVAICGGAGSFLLPKAIKLGADIYISADFKYHEFFDSNNRIIIADIGHYESEQYTIQLLFEIIKNKFSNFAVHLTKVNTNPVNYL